MWDTLFRTVVLYITVVAAMRIMGKRQIGELQASELVGTIIISELAAIPMQDLDRPLSHGFIAIGALVALELGITFFLIKNNLFRHIMSGKPEVVIKNGVIDQKKMKQLRMTADDLLEDLRQADIYDIGDVEYGVIETNGKLSAQKRAAAAPATPDGLNVKVPAGDISVLVVCDGKIQKHSMAFLGWDEKKVREVAATHHLGLRDIFMLTANTAGAVKVIKKTDN